MKIQFKSENDFYTNFSNENPKTYNLNETYKITEAVFQFAGEYQLFGFLQLLIKYQVEFKNYQNQLWDFNLVNDSFHIIVKDTNNKVIKTFNFTQENCFLRDFSFKLNGKLILLSNELFIA